MSKPKSQNSVQTGAVQMAALATASTSESETRQMDETEFLLSNPENARRLRKAIAGLAVGEGVERELVECD